MTPHIRAPIALDVEASEQLLQSGVEHEKSSRDRLIRAAGVRPAVSGVPDLRVYLIEGDVHFRLANGSVAIGTDRADARGMNDEQRARYILEVLAHGFHDYATRECVRRFVRYVPQSADE